MKNYIVLLAFICTVFGSCSDFLEERSHDRIIPKTAIDYKEMLYGEVYLREHDEFIKYLDLMTDDVQDVYVSSNNDVRADGWGFYTWQQDPQLRKNGTVFIDNTWANFYKSILTCNLVITDIEAGCVKGRTEDIKDIKAEAHFMRAWHYLLLVNLYGEPYNPEECKKLKGIPLNNLTQADDKKFKRSNLRECYDFIETDILKSIRLFKESKKEKNFFRANIASAYLLASRIFLYQQKWEKAKLYADSTLRENSALLPFKSSSASWWYKDRNRIMKKNNPEILLTFGDGSLTFYPEGASGYFKQSDELYNLYPLGDNRKHAFFPKKFSFSTNPAGPLKYGKTGETGVYGFAFRTAEAYLNRAEALCNTDKYEKAIEDINTIREARYAEDKIEYAEAYSKKECLDIIKKERRLELCFEGFRWFDLKRWDRPSIKHFYTTSNVMGAGEEYILEKNDPAYTLPLPSYIREINTEISRIQRPVRKPVK